jgi:hypothetical protein
MLIAGVILAVLLIMGVLVFRPLIKIRLMRSAAGSLPDENSEETVRHLHHHVEYLSCEIGSRSITEPDKLESAQQYIECFLQTLGIPYERQTVHAGRRDFNNIIVTVPGWKEPPQAIVVGAHYDTVLNTPGADDNASAVSVLLELCRDLKADVPYRTIKLVFFTLEEPPAFDTPYMGSYVCARECRQNCEDILVMICLEMVGYFCNTQNGQEYPLPLLNWFYRTTPDFILVTGDMEAREMVRLTGDLIHESSSLPVEKITAPRFFPGISLSDHSSFWKKGYRAIMVTDTAFYRNPNYHTSRDTIETLDFHKMAALHKGLLHALKILSNREFL